MEFPLILHLTSEVKYKTFYDLTNGRNFLTDGLLLPDFWSNFPTKGVSSFLISPKSISPLQIVEVHIYSQKLIRKAKPIFFFVICREKNNKCSLLSYALGK